MAPRKQPEPQARPEGWTGWTLQPDGTIDIPVGGTVYMLAAPTIGQLRDIELAHAKVNARIRENLEALTASISDADSDDAKAAAARLIDPVAQAEAKYERTALWVDWWVDTVWAVLGVGTAPGKDALPPWLTVPTNTVAALQHWQSTPPVPGGN